MMYYHQGVILLHVINLNGKNSNIKPIHMCMAQFQHFFSYNPTKKQEADQSVSSWQNVSCGHISELRQGQTDWSVEKYSLD